MSYAIYITQNTIEIIHNKVFPNGHGHKDAYSRDE